MSVVQDPVRNWSIGLHSLDETGLLVVHKQRVIAKVGSTPDYDELTDLLSKAGADLTDLLGNQNVAYPEDIMPEPKRFVMRHDEYEDFANKYPFVDNEVEI